MTCFSFFCFTMAMTAMNIHIQARASRTASSGMKISTAVPSERTKRSKYCSRIASRGIQGSLNTVPATFPPAPKDIAQARPPVLQHPPHRGSRARQRTPQRIQVACNRTSYQIIFVWNGRHLTSPELAARDTSRISSRPPEAHRTCITRLEENGVFRQLGHLIA